MVEVKEVVVVCDAVDVEAVVDVVVCGRMWRWR